MEKQKVDQIPVIVSQQIGAQLLGVPKIQSGTGLAMANAVFDLLVEWKIDDKIVGISFDTTSTNTGQYNGACAILERLLGKRLLWLACEHHVFEIMLRAAFEAKFGVSSAPTVPVFDRFQNEWNNIDKTKYQSGIADPIVKDALKNIADDLIRFSQEKVKKKKFARQDYKEILQLTLIFLGSDAEKVTFHVPGGTSQARWMAKAIYVLKIFLFRDQFHLSSHQAATFRDLAIFIVRIYVKTWTLCAIPAVTPG